MQQADYSTAFLLLRMLKMCDILILSLFNPKCFSVSLAQDFIFAEGERVHGEWMYQQYKI